MDQSFFETLAARRDLLALLGGAAALPAMVLPTGAAAAAAPTKPGAINFADPAQNLHAFIKLTGDLDPKKQSFGWFGGEIFAVFDDKPMIPLIGVEGFGAMRASPQGEGRFRIFNRELAFYKDLKTGQFIDEWVNPLTKETCQVSPIHNKIVNAEIAPIIRQDFDGHVVEMPFNPPWQTLGDHVFSTFQVNAAFPNPMKPAAWPRESAGDISRIVEIFQRSTSLSALADPKTTSAPFTGCWTRLSPWLPWMLMGQTKGYLLYRTFMTKVSKADDLPAHLLERTRKGFEEYLTAPGDDTWGQPNDSSFTTYMKERKPAPPKA